MTNGHPLESCPIPATLVQAVGHMAAIGEQVGISVDNMIRMLNNGMSVADLLCVIAHLSENRRGGNHQAV